MLNVLHLGYKNKSASGAEREDGYEIELELPLFDFGATRVARAEATYMQAVNRTAEVAVNAQSEVRESYSAYRTAFDLARHYRDEVVPLRKRISEENLLRYNGMLIGRFELLADAREQVGSVNGLCRGLARLLGGRDQPADRHFRPLAGRGLLRKSIFRQPRLPLAAGIEQDKP